MMIVSSYLSLLTLSVLCGGSAFIGLPSGLTSQGMLFLKR